MFAVHTTETEAVDLVARITAHLPVGSSIGRTLAATRRVVLTDTAIWGYDPTGD